MSAATETFLAINPGGVPIFDAVVKDLGGMWLFPGLDYPVPVNPAAQSAESAVQDKVRA